jgi:hypothetical protein
MAGGNVDWVRAPDRAVTPHMLLLAAIAIALSACGPAPAPSPITVDSAPSVPVVTAAPAVSPPPEESPGPAVSPPPGESPAPTGSPGSGVLPTTRLTFTTDFREPCGSIGGCAAYVVLLPAGETTAFETELVGPGPDQQVLPALIAPGAYTARFRLAAVSDDRQRGAPAGETTVATCELPIEVFNQSAVNVAVTFDSDACEASATYTVLLID